MPNSLYARAFIAFIPQVGLHRIHDYVKKREIFREKALDN